MATCLAVRADPGALGLQQRLVSVYQQNKDAVVRVLAVVADEASQEALQIGTGFFISKEGLVLTNANIIEQAEAVYVEQNHVSYPAKVIGRDLVTNVCVLKAQGVELEGSILALSEAQEELPVASFLLAITCEMGLEPGPSWGLLTGRNLYYGDRTLPTTYIRSDIPSDGGEGGSPVFDMNGRFVGMIVASLVDIRSSFIIPSKALIRVRDDIVFNGHVSYGYLGIRIDESTAVGGAQLLRIAEVKDHSPAAKAGIVAGDTLLRVGEQPIQHLSDLHNAAFFSRIGQYIEVEIVHNGLKKVLSLQVEAQPSAQEVAVQHDGKHTQMAAPQVPDHQPGQEALQH